MPRRNRNARSRRSQKAIKINSLPELPKPEEDRVPSPPAPLTAKQDELIKAIRQKEMVITIGPAGTGKTFIPSCYAGYFYKAGYIGKIVLTRPNMPTGKSLGAFPGTVEEKMANWTRPIVDVLEDYLSKGAVETMIKKGSIEAVPFETIRGRSWLSTFIILDEAQNCTFEELKAFVTRIGEGCKVVINGDLNQTDLGAKSGFAQLIDIIGKSEELSQNVPVVKFTSDDIVRSGLCKAFVKAFEKNT